VIKFDTGHRPSLTRETRGDLTGILGEGRQRRQGRQGILGEGRQRRQGRQVVTLETKRNMGDMGDKGIQRRQVETRGDQGDKGNQGNKVKPGQTMGEKGDHVGPMETRKKEETKEKRRVQGSKERPRRYG